MVNHECYRIKNQIVLWYHKTEPVTHFKLIRSIRSGRAHLLYMHCCVDLEPGYTYYRKIPLPTRCRDRSMAQFPAMEVCNLILKSHHLIL